jgi:hypothetical protein
MAQWLNAGKFNYREEIVDTAPWARSEDILWGRREGVNNQGQRTAALAAIMQSLDRSR